jgi:hypothetical protein
MSQNSDEYTLTALVAAILLTARMTVSSNVMSSKDEKVSAITEARELLEIARAQQ